MYSVLKWHQIVCLFYSLSPAFTKRVWSVIHINYSVSITSACYGTSIKQKAIMFIFASFRVSLQEHWYMTNTRSNRAHTNYVDSLAPVAQGSNFGPIYGVVMSGANALRDFVDQGIACAVTLNGTETNVLQNRPPHYSCLGNVVW